MAKSSSPFSELKVNGLCRNTRVKLCMEDNDFLFGDVDGSELLLGNAEQLLTLSTEAETLAPNSDLIAASCYWEMLSCFSKVRLIRARL